MRPVELDDFEAIAVGALVRQPPWAELNQRASRRRRRRLATMATILTALVAGVASLLGGTLVAVQNEKESEYQVGMVVLDSRTVVASRYGPCGVQFQVTTDGGVTWGPVTGPEPWGEDCAGGKPPPQASDVFDERTSSRTSRFPGGSGGM